MPRLKSAVFWAIIIILVLSSGCAGRSDEDIALPKNTGQAQVQELIQAKEQTLEPIQVQEQEQAQEQTRRQDQYSSFSVVSDDGQILIFRDGADADLCGQLSVEIFSDDECIFAESCPADQNLISFTGGTHGQLYTVYAGDTTGSVTCERLFLDYDMLPDLPVICINTDSGLDPVYEMVMPEKEGLHGTTISGNEYMKSSVEIYGLSSGPITDTARIKVRGNASNFSYNGKVNYRLNFENKHDLTGGRNSLMSKQWILLNTGSSLNTFIGDRLSEMVGMEYTSDMIFVNVMLNGDWKGCYCLTPAVTRSNMKNYVEASGYIFENDVYFWNENGLYFQTDYSIESMGYTFTYPDIADMSSPKAAELQNYLRKFEEYLYLGDIRYRDYIDESSFAKWLLVRDVMGEGDPLGANVYYYKRDLDPEDPTSTKLKMGPLWDFDTMCGSPGEWSGSRKYGVTYFEELMKQPEFKELYTDLWDELAPGLIDGISAEIDSLDQDALNKSWALDQSRWNYDISTFKIQRNRALNWFNHRSGWITKKLLLEEAENGPLDVSAFTIISDEVEYSVDSVYETDDLYHISGWAISKTIPYDSDQMQIALLKDGKINLTGSAIRPDVKKAYDLNYLRPGFYAYTDYSEDYTVVIIDYYNRLLYTP